MLISESSRREWARQAVAEGFPGKDRIGIGDCVKAYVWFSKSPVCEVSKMEGLRYLMNLMCSEATSVLASMLSEEKEPLREMRES